MLKRSLGLLLVPLALLSGCGSLDNRVAATCDDEVGDVKEPYAWADVRSATVIADQDTIEAVVEFAEPLPDDIHGDITFIVGILRPPDDDRSVLGEASGTAFIVAEAHRGAWTFGVIDGRRNDAGLAVIGTGEVGTKTVRLTMPTSRIGRTGTGSGWNMTVQPYGVDIDQGDQCPGGRDGIPGGIDF